MYQPFHIPAAVPHACVTMIAARAVSGDKPVRVSVAGERGAVRHQLRIQHARSPGRLQLHRRRARVRRCEGAPPIHGMSEFVECGGKNATDAMSLQIQKAVCHSITCQSHSILDAVSHLLNYVSLRTKRGRLGNKLCKLCILFTLLSAASAGSRHQISCVLRSL